MFSDEARKCVQDAILNELDNAVRNYGAGYHSLHEGYAVLLEEVEEAEDDLNNIKENLGEIWSDIKTNSMKDTLFITRIEAAAQLLALEAVQIAAVCTKFKGGM